jgi:hypothetical protein
MEIDIYKSNRDGEKFLSVPTGTDLARMPFPADLDPDLLQVSPFSTRLNIQPGDHRVALNSEDIIRQITDKGFATHEATIKVTVTHGSP